MLTAVPRCTARRSRAASSPATSRRAASCASAAQAPVAAWTRRAALPLLLLPVLLPAPPTWAGVMDDRGYVDRSRDRGRGDCPLGDEGAACRRQLLDTSPLETYDEALKVGTLEGGNRGTVSANGASTAGRSAGDERYAAESAALLALLRATLDADLYDPGREALVADLKGKGNSWAGAYAPGGSSKRASGRALYNALNQAQGAVGRGQKTPHARLWHVVPLRFACSTDATHRRAFRVQRPRADRPQHAREGGAQPGGGARRAGPGALRGTERAMIALQSLNPGLARAVLSRAQQGLGGGGSVNRSFPPQQYSPP